MAQGPGSARWCGKDGCGVGVVRTGAARLALLRNFPRHHTDHGQSRGLPGEKGSLSFFLYPLIIIYATHKSVDLQVPPPETQVLWL